MTAPSTRDDGLVLAVLAPASEMRATVEPLAWVVLEELATRSVVIAGEVLAAESARSLAAALGRSKDAVARALRQLATAGLIERVEARHGESGQFAGGHYRLDLAAAGLQLAQVRPPVTRTAPRPPAAPAPRSERSPHRAPGGRFAHLPPPPPPASRSLPTTSFDEGRLF